MKILFASAEAAPFFKTGGLGDVSYALPKALKAQGIDVRVVLPYYTLMSEEYKEACEDLLNFQVEMGYQRQAYVGIKRLILDDLTYYFVDNLDYFNRPSLYGYEDDCERFAFFDLAVIEMMQKVDFIPNIIHVNDWQTAMIPALLVDKYHWLEDYRDIRKVLTIHNIQFQGWTDKEALYSYFNTTDATFHDKGCEHHGAVNYLKGGINFSDIVTTVSPRYAGEIQTPEFGEGLDACLRDNHFKIRGIINGIDYDLNNPKTDPNLAVNYDAQTVQSAKLKNKIKLQERVGLAKDPDAVLLGLVSRLTPQKGMQLIQEKAEELLNTRRVQVLVLGTGDDEFEHSFRYFEHKYPGRFCAYIDFDIHLAQQIYAGSDLFLMPSAFEPCGLSQMIAMRYGTLPLVHEVGGLADTVEPYNHFTGEGTGFSFNQFNGRDFLKILNYAVDVYEHDKKAWQALIQEAMSRDFSWQGPAEDYIQVYQSLLEA
ncbi:glycogen synthase GlgA [Aerococcus sanguinicola]|uniref:glycogen synthase GlgA n=1 Tax=unclassified Aerococcus TaxID=2618060 RepID=UPI0008A607A7|nr:MULTISPECIES: glycogen synthase GlgA [unclassified Aerococcus]KAB0645966.1 glycogen synthase GlgA [Aerococcus sanguinicola]MDK6234249.1 glycogen synthase GlgA [Aerococcus sp. UMB10185]MDK6855400.1 glycogen synthase GlgA [Aerococcus sp. UMB7533]OFN05488.1 starch synthase [Aerococcus sp. HMSC062A02]OHO44840.1 starch synthase [Aerococcus sp. HMSC035B07]